MKIPLKKAFDVEAFEKIKAKIDGDITLSEAYTLSHELKDIERAYEYSWGMFFILMGMFIAYIRIMYVLFFPPVTSTLTKPTSAVLVIVLLIFILGTLFQLRCINNYLVYKKHYHQEYIDFSKQLEEIINALDAKDTKENLELLSFLAERGPSIYYDIESLLNKEEKLNHTIKKRLLEEIKLALNFLNNPF